MNYFVLSAISLCYIHYTYKFIILFLRFKRCMWVRRRAFLAELKAEGRARESASRVEVKMLAAAVEERLEHHIRVNVWNELKIVRK